MSGDFRNPADWSALLIYLEMKLTAQLRGFLRGNASSIPRLAAALRPLWNVSNMIIDGCDLLTAQINDGNISARDNACLAHDKSQPPGPPSYHNDSVLKGE